MAGAKNRMWRQKKIRVKTNKIAVTVFVLCVLAMVVSYCITQFMLLRTELNNFTNEIRNDTKKNVVVAKNLLDGMVKGLEHTAQAINEYDDLWDPEVKKILHLSQRMNNFDAVFISDINGNAYSDTGYAFSVLEESFFPEAMKGKVVFSEIMPSQRYKAIQIISFPLYSEKHELNGVLFGLFDVETFSRLINSVVDYKERMYVIDANGTYINCFDKNHTLPERTNFWDNLKFLNFDDSTIDEIQKDFREQREGEFSYSIEGVQRYGCHMPLGIQNWQIVLMVEETVVNSHIRLIQIVVALETVVNAALLTVMLICIYSYFKSANREIREAHQKISKSNEMMRMTVEHSNQIIFEYDIQKQQINLITQIKNELFKNQTIGPVPECIMSQNIISADSVNALKAMFEQIKTEKSSQADIQLADSPQQKIWYRITMQNVYNEQGKIVGTVGSAVDISALKKGEEAIKRKEETYNILIKKAVMYARIDLNSDTVLELNGKESHIPYENGLYKSILKSISKEHRPYAARELSLKLLKREYEQEETLEIQCIMKMGHEAKWVSCSVYRVQAKDRMQITLVILDIDKKKREEIALKKQAERDGLTGLYNAAATRSKISEILCAKHSSEERQIFILLDLDNFKQINDTFGHAWGDQVLMEVAAVLNQHFRSSDIVGRLGGDEFVIFLCNVKSDYLIDTLLDGLNTVLTKTYMQGDVSVTVSASMGVAVAPKDGITLEELYKKADVALYQTKNKRKNINREPIKREES